MTKRKARQPGTRTVSSDNPKDRAFMATVPEMANAAVMDVFDVYGGQDLSEMTHALHERCEAVVNGSTKGIERMLVSQAHALEAIFVKEARRASTQEFLPQYEAFMKLALRAQNQCRMTLETLSAIKNPPVVFAKQANIAHGHQQVNNATAPRADETEKPQSELLEAPHAKPEWMDAGAAGTATPSDPAMAAVETIDGAAHDSGQSNVKP